MTSFGSRVFALCPASVDFSSFTEMCQAGSSIGSGDVESTVKQIGRRVKISGAQWERANVPQVLKQRSAYLNGKFSS